MGHNFFGLYGYLSNLRTEDDLTLNEAHNTFILNSASDFMILRPNIEHEMLGVVFGRGGTQELGSTFWGQTELSCYDDAQHGIWGMSYKYHERALVTNEKNLVRVYDVAFDGYNGGNDSTVLNWTDDSKIEDFRSATIDKSIPYDNVSNLVMRLPHNPHRNPISNPLIFGQNPEHVDAETGATAKNMNEHTWNGSGQKFTIPQKVVLQLYWNKLNLRDWNPMQMRGKLPGEQSVAGETGQQCMAFQGTLQQKTANGNVVTVHTGSGHLGSSFPGVASIREGRGQIFNKPTQAQMMHLV